MHTRLVLYHRCVYPLCLLLSDWLVIGALFFAKITITKNVKNVKKFYGLLIFHKNHNAGSFDRKCLSKKRKNFRSFNHNFSGTPFVLNSFSFFFFHNRKQLFLINMKHESTHLALRLPEVVSHILSFIVPNCYYDEPNTKTLYTNVYSCLFVNRLWHDCASRIIWRKAFFDDTKEDLEALLKFSSIIYKQPSPRLHDEIQKPKATSWDDSAMVIEDLPMLMYPSRSSSISSVSTFDSIDITSSKCPKMDYTICTIDEKENESLTMIVGSDDYLRQARVSTYCNAVKSLCIRKIKDKSINEPLARIGENARNLEYLDIYICDNFMNETLYPFLLHRGLTYLSLAGCHNISDEAISRVAEYCKGLEHLDLRACGLVSDVSISKIALNCPHLRHLNVGRIRDRERVTSKSITLIGKYTQATVLGLAGCDVDDECMQVIAEYRKSGLERISLNSCFKISNETVYTFVKHCPSLSVFEMKECHRINDWEAVATFVQRKVLLTLCDHQNRACADWARVRGRALDVKSPLK